MKKITKKFLFVCSNCKEVPKSASGYLTKGAFFVHYRDA